MRIGRLDARRSCGYFSNTHPYNKGTPNILRERQVQDDKALSALYQTYTAKSGSGNARQSRLKGSPTVFGGYQKAGILSY